MKPLYLKWFIENNHFAEVEKIIRNKKFDINKSMIDGSNLTPLQFVIVCHRQQFISLFLKYGANIDGFNKLGDNPLSHMIKYMDDQNCVERKIFENICQLGADVNQIDKNNYSLLELAIIGGKLHFLELLLKSNAMTDGRVHRRHGIDGDTILHTAIRLERVDVIKLLLHFQINADTYNSENESPIKLAIRNQPNLKIIKSLLKYNLKLNLNDFFTIYHMMEMQSFNLDIFLRIVLIVIKQTEGNLEHISNFFIATASRGQFMIRELVKMKEKHIDYFNILNDDIPSITHYIHVFIDFKVYDYEKNKIMRSYPLIGKYLLEKIEAANKRQLPAYYAYKQLKRSAPQPIQKDWHKVDFLRIISIMSNIDLHRYIGIIPLNNDSIIPYLDL